MRQFIDGLRFTHHFQHLSATRLRQHGEHPRRILERLKWNALFAPSATAPALITKIAADTDRVLKQADVQERFAALGLEIAATPPTEAKAFFDAEIEKWAKVIRSIGIAAQ